MLLTEQQAEEATASAAVIAVAHDKAREEVTNAIAKEKAAAVRAAGDIEVQRIRREVEAQKDKERRAELAQKAQSAEVKSILAPFLAKGRLQPLDLQRSNNPSSLDEKPVSFSQIGQYGALNDETQGLSRLLLLANNRHDTRPRWAISSDKWSKKDIEFLRRAQELLRELGPTLVELGMLSP